MFWTIKFHELDHPLDFTGFNAFTIGHLQLSSAMCIKQLFAYQDCYCRVHQQKATTSKLKSHVFQCIDFCACKNLVIFFTKT